MKNLYLPIVAFILGSSLYGQYDHNIHFTNGDTITHNVTEIDSISFSTDGLPVMHLNHVNGSTNNYALGLINQVIFSGDSMIDLYPPGTVHCIPGGAQVIEVLHPLTGRIWMDRNLGATQAATAPNDEAAYGDLYQWGRFSDGHQCRNSDTTSTNASTVAPNEGNPWDGKFLLDNIYPWDWLSPQNDNLWQGLYGINNPCPDDFRIPTDAEWLSLNISNSSTAWSSVLKLPEAGFRLNFGGIYPAGEIYDDGVFGYFWSSTAWDTLTGYFNFYSAGAGMTEGMRARGCSVRCIKD